MRSSKIKIQCTAVLVLLAATVSLSVDPGVANPLTHIGETSVVQSLMFGSGRKLSRGSKTKSAPAATEDDDLQPATKQESKPTEGQTQPTETSIDAQPVPDLIPPGGKTSAKIADPAASEPAPEAVRPTKRTPSGEKFLDLNQADDVTEPDNLTPVKNSTGWNDAEPASKTKSSQPDGDLTPAGRTKPKEGLSNSQRAEDSNADLSSSKKPADAATSRSQKAIEPNDTLSNSKATEDRNEDLTKSDQATDLTEDSASRKLAEPRGSQSRARKASTQKKDSASSINSDDKSSEPTAEFSEDLHSADLKPSENSAGSKKPPSSVKDKTATDPSRPASQVSRPKKVNREIMLVDLFRTGLTNTDLRTVGDLLIKLRREVTNNPQDPSLRIRLGSHLYLAGDYEGAATEMKRAIALRPDDVIGHTLLAKLLDEAGDQSAAHAEFQRAIEIDPRFPDARVFFAESLLKHGGISEAIDEFRRANEARPTTDGLSGLSEALVIVQDKDGAVTAARQAVSVMPNSAKAHVALTRALLASKENQSALRTARQATLLDPTSADSHIALGRALYANGGLPGAVQEFQQAVSLDPLNAQARNDLGFALYGLGDIASAVTQLQLALRLNPHLSEARNNLEIAIFGLSGSGKK
jgi:Flp pilus assembly protein TadD